MRRSDRSSVQNSVSSHEKHNPSRECFDRSFWCAACISDARLLRSRHLLCENHDSLEESHEFCKDENFTGASLLLLSLSALYGFAQSVTSGDLTGTVTDTSGAVIPEATVTLKSTSEGTTQTTVANQSGAYHFSLLKPGNYMVSATASNMSRRGAR